MKKYILPVLLSVTCFFSLVGQVGVPRVDKIILKTIDKIWDDQNIVIESVPMYGDEVGYGSLLRLVTGNETTGWVCIRRAYGCQIGGCGTGNYNSSSLASDGFVYEVFDYAIFLDKGMDVIKVVVTDYPGDYGYEICSHGWLKQFVGYDGGDLHYGSDIDAISGATISAQSITLDIAEAFHMIQEWIEKTDLDSLSTSH